MTRNEFISHPAAKPQEVGMPIGFVSPVVSLWLALQSDISASPTMLLRNAAPALLLPLLIACAGTQPLDDPASAATKPPVPEMAAPVPERAFPEDALYPLLVAEFALRRKAYDVALDNYMELAPKLRDKGISAHTTHLGQYMQRESEALAAVRLWVELEPTHAEANHTLGNLLIRKGDSLGALEHLAAAQRNGASVHFPSTLSGIRSLQDTQKEQLLRGIDALASEFPDNEKLALTQALGRAEVRQPDVALNHLTRLFELNPNNTRGMVLEAKLLAEQDAEAPLARIEQALANDGENSELRLQYARLLTQTDIEKARGQFEILSANSPRDGDLLFSLALLNRELNDPLAAAAYLRQVLALDQRVDEANYYLGRISEDRGDETEALAHYMRVEDSNQFMPANNRIGKLLLAAGEKDRSLAWFEQQRQENPSRTEPLYALEAELLSSAGDHQRAMALLDSALTKKPGSASLRYARAMLREKTDDLSGVERDLRQILEEEPENTTALNALGYILADRTDRLSEAQSLISRALQLQPNEPAILDSMGWVLFRQGRHEESLDFLRRAYAEFPDPEVAAHLGEVLWTTGSEKEAIKIWQDAALIDPDHKILRGTLQRLGVTLPATADNATTP